MIVLKSCPNCGGKQFGDYRIIPWGKFILEFTPGIKFPTTLIITYVICKSCRLVFQNPRMSDRELNIYYNSGFYRKTVRIPEGGMDKGEESRAITDREIIKKYVPLPNSHLDIGCGRGYLLDMMAAKVKVGIELDKKYVTKNEIKIYPNLDNVEKQKFRLVTAIHLLEHVSKPLAFLKKMVNCVDDGGYLIIEVPSLKTPGGSLGLPHLSHFDTDVLRLMCLEAGLKIEAVEFTPHLLVVCRK